MPLSEHEQRLLEQIERALYADDPKFASTVKSSDPRNYLRRRVWRSLLLFLLGLVVLVLGVVLNKGPALTVVLGVAGFVVMLAAALRGANDLKRLSGRPEPTRKTARSGKPAKPTKASPMERLEERWKRRWEERG
jgi:hypothetical protein